MEEMFVFSAKVEEQANRLGVDLKENPTTEPCTSCGEIHSALCFMPVEPTRRRAQQAADQLASDAWERRDVPGELERSDETRKLVVDQLNDDIYSISSRPGRGRTKLEKVGRDWVVHHGFHGSSSHEEYGLKPFSIWPSRTPDQLALEAGMRGFLEGLPGELRMYVDWYFGGQLTEREIANVTGKSQPTVHRRVKEAVAELKQALRKAFPYGEESGGDGDAVR